MGFEKFPVCVSEFSKKKTVAESILIDGEKGADFGSQAKARVVKRKQCFNT